MFQGDNCEALLRIIANNTAKEGHYHFGIIDELIGLSGTPKEQTLDSDPKNTGE